MNKFILIFLLLLPYKCFAGIDDPVHTIEEQLPAIEAKYEEARVLCCKALFHRSNGFEPCDYSIGELKKLYESINLADDNKIDKLEVLEDVVKKSGYYDFVANIMGKYTGEVNLYSSKSQYPLINCRMYTMGKDLLGGQSKGTCRIAPPYSPGGVGPSSRYISVGEYKSSIKEKYNSLKAIAETEKQAIAQKAEQEKKFNAALDRFNKGKPAWDKFVAQDAARFRKNLKPGAIVTFFKQGQGLTIGVLISKKGELVEVDNSGYITRMNISEVWPKIPQNLVMYALYDYSAKIVGSDQALAIVLDGF
jgi:hypothetical protein